MRYIFLLLAGLELVSPSFLRGQDLPARELYERFASSVFRITTRYGAGTGFLVDKNGLVLTNAHVVAGVRQVGVQLDDTIKVRGVVLSRDPSADLAVIAISAEAVTSLEPLPLDAGGFDQIRVAQRILTMGYPLERGPVLTTGMIAFVGGGDINRRSQLEPRKLGRAGPQR
jgi:S1-C subfamily serine protease